MNECERYIETFRFRLPDRIPVITMEPRESTLKRWHKEGVSSEVDWFFESMVVKLRIPMVSISIVWPKAVRGR